MNWLKSRLSETSTWRGIFAIATATGVTLNEDQQNAIIALGLAAIGLINVFYKEKTNADTKKLKD